MNLSKSPIPLVCPSCRTHLTLVDEGKFYCSQCKCPWPIYDNVPNFIDTDKFWAEPGFTRENLQQINEHLKHSDWKRVLSNHESPQIREQFHFISDLNRARWHKLIDISEDSVILDLGAGMGTISQSLSTRYKAIYAVEPLKERVEFMKLRFKQEQCHNIAVIRSDIDHLPFPETSFDLIILNGVLEWLPFNVKNGNPRKSQLHYLKLLRGLLKKRGYIYIGIENRFNFRLFLGANDPHVPLKYVTVLPRLLSHIICKYKIGDIYRPYLYSHNGYKRLLGDAGFKNIEIYSSLPSYNDPQHLLNLKDKDSSSNLADLIFTSKRRPAKLIKKVLLETDILKYLGYAYVIFARNEL